MAARFPANNVSSEPLSKAQRLDDRSHHDAEKDQGRAPMRENDALILAPPLLPSTANHPSNAAVIAAYDARFARLSARLRHWREGDRRMAEVEAAWQIRSDRDADRRMLEKLHVAMLSPDELRAKSLEAAMFEVYSTQTRAMLALEKRLEDRRRVARQVQRNLNIMRRTSG